MLSYQSSNTVPISLLRSPHWLPTALKKKKKKAKTFSCQLAFEMLHSMAAAHLCTLSTSIKWILFMATRTHYGCLCLCWLSCFAFPLGPTILWRSCCVPSPPICPQTDAIICDLSSSSKFYYVNHKLIKTETFNWYTVSPKWSQLLRIRKNDSVLVTILSYTIRFSINACR